MSSAPAPFRLRLTAAQDGLDPYTHYWYRVGHRSYRRVCDDAPWVGGAQYESPPNVDCTDCSIMHHHDRRYGRKMFKLTRVPKGHLSTRPDDVLYNEEDQFSIKVVGAMMPVPMWQFTEYYLGDDDVRKQIVLEYLGHSKAKAGGGPDAFKPLREAFMQLNGTVEALRSRPPRPLPWCRDQYAATYAAIIETMVTYCDRYQVKPYGALSTQVTIGGASIWVKADFRMESTAIGNGAVKLWLRDEPMPDIQENVVISLLDAARRTAAFWDERYPYIWPIRKEEAPRMRIPSDDVREGVNRAGADFMERCHRLRKQYHLPMPGDGDDKE